MTPPARRTTPLRRALARASLLAFPLALLPAVLPGLSPTLPRSRTAAAPIEISTGSLEKAIAWTPLEFALADGPAAVRLIALPGGESVPCQVERPAGGGPARLLWIAREVPRGGAGRWRIEAAAGAPAPGVEVKKAGDGAVQVLAGGKEVARLVSGQGEQKPYLFPLFGPSGLLMTRRFPMEKKVQGEEQDHPHQRSLWFSHGSVQGVDFWSEGSRAGTIRQVELVAAEGGPVCGRISTRNEWIAPAGARLSDGRQAPPEGEKLLEDRRTLTFYPLDRGALLIDVTISLRPVSGPVAFGDTKEGTFGIRLAETMKEDRGGTILNARGQRTGKEAWGQPAEWVDYFGPLGGETVGVAILDHPTSFRHPTTWHVRGYGLFAANPFGYGEFFKGKAEKKDGNFTLEPGKSMEFRYRVYLHHGDTEAAKVAAVYQGFARPPAVKQE